MPQSRSAKVLLEISALFLFILLIMGSSTACATVAADASVLAAPLQPVSNQAAPSAGQIQVVVSAPDSTVSWDSRERGPAQSSLCPY